MRSITVSAIAAALIAVACSTVSAASPRGVAVTFDYTFDQYVRDFGKPHVRGTAEYSRREELFKASLARVVAHNSNPNRAYTKGVNRMSDWTAAEYKSIRGARHDPTFESPRRTEFKSGSGSAADSIDWRTAQPAVLTTVKDQGMCGDCWAHATTEAVESAHARATGDLLVLSQQQTTSCTPAAGFCGGCNGFFPQYAYNWMTSGDGNVTEGIVEEWYYSFTSWFGNTGECLTHKTKPPISPNGLVTTVKVSGYQQVTPNDQTAVMEALTTLGPLSILVDASAWQEYESGIFTDCAPHDENFALDHAVMLVGYGYDAGLDQAYWIVRNSWSAGWGENGYVRILKNDAPKCGPTYSLSCTNQTHNYKACGPCGLLVDAQFPTVATARRGEDL